MQGLICSSIARLTSNDSNELQDEVLYGTLVEILDEVNYSYYIKTFYHYKGFVKKDNVFIIKSNICHLDTYNGIITKHFVDVLQEPIDKSSILISLPRGSYIRILPEITGSFQKIELINNKKGYIKKDSFKYRKKANIKENENQLRDSLVSNAMLYLGCQYRWGGKTILGIDCSGLCQMSYLLEEIMIYRDSNFNDEILKQYQLRKITLDDVLPGDLIYLPGHIMMSIGNNQYIHSSSTKSGVVLDHFNKLDKTILGCATIF